MSRSASVMWNTNRQIFRVVADVIRPERPHIVHLPTTLITLCLPRLSTFVVLIEFRLSSQF